MQSSNRIYATSPLNASCPSFAPTTSSVDQYTTTSSGTIYGPGSLTGKALRALGKATIRSVDQILIRRKLLNIAAYFPHADLNAAVRIKGIASMYDDLLELSRTGFYSSEIRARALRLLAGQITRCQTKMLVEAISRWDAIELQLFVVDLLAQSPPIWVPPSSYEPRTEINVSLPTELWPFILFISRVLRINSSSCKAVLEAGYLDVLCSMCESDFEFLFASSIPIPQHLRHYVQTACNISLLDIVAYPELRSTVLHHPIVDVWPQRRRTTKVPAPMGYSTFLLEDYEHLYMSDQSPYFELSLPEVCQMKCVSAMDAQELLGVLSNHITQKQAFSIYLRRLAREDKLAVFRDMISYLTNLTETNAQYVHLFFTLSRYSELLYFLMLCTERIRFDHPYVGILLEAGIETFLLRILSAEVQLQFPFKVATPEDLSLVSTDNETLLDSICRRGLKSLLSQGLYTESYTVQLIHDLFFVLLRPKALRQCGFDIPP